MSLFSSLGILQENWKLFHHCSIIKTSSMTWDLCLWDSFLPIPISSILVANIGMRLVTLIWEEFVFFGAGSDTFWLSKRFRKTFQLTFSPWIPLWVHLKSFKNIKMLFFNAHPAKCSNVELAGFINTFGKRVDTGLRKMFFHNQLDHATLCLDVLSTLFWGGL